MESTLIGKTVFKVIGHHIKAIGVIVHADEKIVAFCDCYKNGMVRYKMNRNKFNFILSENIIKVKTVTRNKLIDSEMNKYDLSSYKTIKEI